jgi:hypothetical protein
LRASSSVLEGGWRAGRAWVGLGDRSWVEISSQGVRPPKKPHLMAGGGWFGTSIGT